MSKKRRYRQMVENDLDTLPLMGLFVVLIPMLLLSAVFLEISVIDMTLPSEDQTNAVDESENLALSIKIGEHEYVVEFTGYPAKVISRDVVESQALLAEELGVIATNVDETQAVTIISEPHTRYEDIIDVMDISRDAGLPMVSLLGEEL